MAPTLHSVHPPDSMEQRLKAGINRIDLPLRRLDPAAGLWPETRRELTRDRTDELNRNRRRWGSVRPIAADHKLDQVPYRADREWLREDGAGDLVEEVVRGGGQCPACDENKGIFERRKSGFDLLV
jgi:hypothetical protein